MKNPYVALVSCVLLTVSAASAKEESFALYENHHVAIAVPEGYTVAKDFSEIGVVSLKIADPKKEISLEITLLPDPEGNFEKARPRKEAMAEKFQGFVPGSVEKSMQFEELMTRTGSGTYCVFQDAALVGKSELPPNEYLHVTVGIKSWAGCAAFFTLFSNNLNSQPYEAAFKILLESVHEKAAPVTL